MRLHIISRDLIAVFLAGLVALGTTGFAGAEPDISKYLRGTWKDQEGKTYEIVPDERSTIGSAKLVWPLPLERRSESVSYRYKRYKLGKFYFVHGIDRPDKIDDRIPLSIRKDAIKKRPEYRWVLKIEPEKKAIERLFTEFELPRITYTEADPPIFRSFKYTVNEKSKKTLTPVPTCGPDITNNLLWMVDHIIRQFERWKPILRRSYCFKLFDFGLKDRAQELLNWIGGKDTQPLTRPPFEHSWDIRQLAPSKRFTEVVTKHGNLMISGYNHDAPACAKPRWPCGLTVRFFDQCVHFQVLNYIEWGVINSLCGTQTKGSVVHKERATCKGMWEEFQNEPIIKQLGKQHDGALDFVADYFKTLCQDEVSNILKKFQKPTHSESIGVVLKEALKVTLKEMLSGSDDPAWRKLLERQLVFSNLGQDLVAQSKPLRDRDGNLKSYVTFRGLVQRLFETHIAGASGWASREETKCRLQCTMTATEKSKLEKLPFNYQFGDYVSHRRTVDE